MTLAITLIIIAVANFLFGATVFARRYRHPLHQSFLMMTIGVGVWSLAIGLYFMTSDIDQAVLYANIYYTAALLIASSLFAFSYSLKSNDEGIELPVLLALFVPFLYAVSAIVYPNILISVERLPYDITLNATPYLIYSLTFGALFVIAVVKLIAAAHSSAARRRKQLSVVCAGVILAGLVGISFNLVLPALGHYHCIWFGPAFSLVFLISTSYAVVRYRLFDLRLAFARALAYLIALFWVIIIYAVALFVIGLTLFGQSNASNLQNLVYLGLAVLLTFTFQPLKRFFDTFTRHLFFKQPLNPEAVIEKFGDLILGEVELESLARGVFRIIDNTFQPVASVLWVYDPSAGSSQTMIHPKGKISERQMEGVVRALDAIPQLSLIDADEPGSRQETDLAPKLEEIGLGLVIRIQTTKRHIGYLMVGHRRNGGGYNSLDRYVLTTAADELALAIENSLQFRQITEFNRTLQARIDEATRELRLTNKKLHDLDESKDEFISMASHQLRTPLTTVKGYISMLLDGDVGAITPQQREVLEEAFNSSQRMVFLIGDFLNVSRLQAGRFELELRESNLAELIAREVEQMQESAHSRKMKLLYEKPSAVPEIRLDENKIRQVVMNFIDNAIYYSKPGDTIRITLMRHAGYIAFRVIDHGIGVPAGERHKLFAKFYRASNAKKQRPDGTGIGLFMARKVVVAHGGTIICETTEGKGSTFGFRLPLEPSEDPAE